MKSSRSRSISWYHEIVDISKIMSDELHATTWCFVGAVNVMDTTWIRMYLPGMRVQHFKRQLFLEFRHISMEHPYDWYPHIKFDRVSSLFLIHSDFCTDGTSMDGPFRLEICNRNKLPKTP